MCMTSHLSVVDDGACACISSGCHGLLNPVIQSPAPHSTSFATKLADSHNRLCVTRLGIFVYNKMGLEQQENTYN